MSNPTGSPFVLGDWHVDPSTGVVRRGDESSRLQPALVHGSELRTDPASPERGSLRSVAVRHAETGHRVEDLARQLYLNSLSSEGSTSHRSTDDRLVTVHGVLHHAALAVA